MNEISYILMDIVHLSQFHYLVNFQSISHFGITTHVEIHVHLSGYHEQYAKG